MSRLLNKWVNLHYKSFKSMRKTVPEYNRIQIFPFGSDKIEIDSLMEHLSKLKERGFSHFHMAPPNKDVQIGDIRFYSVKYREETNAEVLDRYGIHSSEEKATILEALAELKGGQ